MINRFKARVLVAAGLIAIGSSALAAVDAPRGSGKILEIKSQIIVSVSRCVDGKEKTLGTRYYTPEEMALYGLAYMDISDQSGKLTASVEITQVPKDNPSFIKAELYLYNTSSISENLYPVVSMILGFSGVNDKLDVGQVSAYSPGASSNTCKNPLNEGRYFIDLLKGNIL